MTFANEFRLIEIIERDYLVRVFWVNGLIRLECRGCRRRVVFDNAMLNALTVTNEEFGIYLNEVISKHKAICEKTPQAIIRNIPEVKPEPAKPYRRKFELD